MQNWRPVYLLTEKGDGMNNQRRKELNRISTEMSVATIDDLESIKSDIEMVLMDEEMAFENMPEGIQMSYRGEMSEEAQDNMNDAIDQIDDFLSEYGEGSEATEEKKESALQELIDNVTEALTMAAE